MIKSFIFVCFLSLMTAVPWFNVHADSFSCEGGIVSTDDRSSDVLAKCGSPDFRDSHQEEVVQRLDDDTKQKVYITVEEWTYNLGPNQFTRIVVLKNSRIAEIRTGSYGYKKQ
jgi:Protein of unknown function (DUF2845)